MTLAMRLEPARDGVNGVVLDRFLHALVDSAQDDGYRVLLYTAADDAREIDAFEELLSTSGVDGVVLTSTHHGDPRTAWLTRRGVPFSSFGRPWGEPEA
ncbi:MAG: LacI family transcriptional regulator, partial [Actinomycetota bacterium]